MLIYLLTLASKLNHSFPSQAKKKHQNNIYMFVCFLKSQFSLSLTNIGLATNDDLDLRALKGSNSNSLVTAEAKPADSCLVERVKAATPKL